MRSSHYRPATPTPGAPSPQGFGRAEPFGGAPGGGRGTPRLGTYTIIDR